MSKISHVRERYLTLEISFYETKTYEDQLDEKNRKQKRIYCFLGKIFTWNWILFDRCMCYCICELF